jgi:crossover junction endodeoxyribonuclease RusA
MMILDLPFPAKALWPNGRPHPMQRHSAAKKHKLWAANAVRAEKDRPDGERLQLVAAFHCKPRGPLPDRDNASASLKAYQDGIAAALGVDDRHFAEPVILFADRHPLGKVVIEVRS